MGEFGRRLDDLTIRALSPDGRIRAVLRGRGQAVVSFADPEDFYDYNDADRVCDQVSELLDRVYDGLKRGRAELVAKHTRLEPNTGPHWDVRVRRMREELDGLTVDGEAQGDAVRVRTVGLRSWRVRIRPGMYENMTAEQFCRAVNGCVQDACGRYLSEMRSVKTKTLGDLAPDAARR
ncbi:hypothetical protein [Stackebrandtia soli]|uniref:hypothetical protein n=1 Tax=Stackebrandtia soli TaxID=1892856 RepID=UPI0039EC737F